MLYLRLHFLRLLPRVAPLHFLVELLPSSQLLIIADYLAPPSSLKLALLRLLSIPLERNTRPFKKNLTSGFSKRIPCKARKVYFQLRSPGGKRSASLKIQCFSCALSQNISNKDTQVVTVVDMFQPPRDESDLGSGDVTT